MHRMLNRAKPDGNQDRENDSMALPSSLKPPSGVEIDTRKPYLMSATIWMFLAAAVVP